MTKSEKRNELENQRDLLAKELKKLGPFMRGSVTLMGRRHKQPYFSVNIKGKTKVIYLGDNRAKAATLYLENYKRLMQIVEEMTILNMEILKLEKP